MRARYLHPDKGQSPHLETQVLSQVLSQCTVTRTVTMYCHTYCHNVLYIKNNRAIDCRFTSSVHGRLHCNVCARSVALQCLCTVRCTAMSVHGPLHCNVCAWSTALQCVCTVRCTAMRVHGPLHCNLCAHGPLQCNVCQFYSLTSIVSLCRDLDT